MWHIHDEWACSNWTRLHLLWFELHYLSINLFVYKLNQKCAAALHAKPKKKQKTMQNITDLNGSIPAVPEKWLCLGCHNKCKSNIDIIKYYVTSHLSRAAEPWNFRFMPKSITMENIKVKPFTYAKISWQNQSTAHLNFMQSMLHYQPKPRSSPQLYL